MYNGGRTGGEVGDRVQEKNLTGDGARHCGKDIGIYLELEALDCGQTTQNYARLQDSLAFQCPVCRV
jgi:hypothetical protein